MKRKFETSGIDPKVPTQAVATVVAFVAGYFGVDLDPEVATGIAIVIGFLAGFVAPAPVTIPVERRAQKRTPPDSERRVQGYSLVEVAVFLLIVVIALVLLFSSGILRD